MSRRGRRARRGGDPPGSRRAGSPSTLRLLLTSSLANLTIPLSAVITGPVLARALGPEDRGELAAVLVPFVFLAFLLNLGIPEALTYFVAKHPRLEAQLTRWAIGLGLLTGLMTAGALWALSGVLLRNSPDAQPILRSLALLMPVYMVMANIRAVVIGRPAFGLVNLERWLRTGTRTLTIVALALAGALTTSSAAWATEGTALVVTAVLLVGLRVRRSGRADPDPTSAPARVSRRAVGRYALQAWVGSLAGVLIIRLDQTLMTPLVGATELGYYAVAVAVAEVPVFAIQAITDIVFSRSARTSDPHVTARVSRCLLVLTAPLAGVGCLLMGWGLPLLYGSDFHVAVPMAQVLLLGTVFSAVASVLGFGLLALGHPGRRSIIQFVGVAVNLPILVLLVPHFGGMGAAWASAVTYVVMAAATSWVFARLTGLPLRALLVVQPGDFRAALRLRGSRPAPEETGQAMIESETQISQQQP